MGRGFNVKVETKDRGAKVERALKDLERCYILVGIPQGTTERRASDNPSPLRALRRNLGEQQISNAELLYIHTNGSPIKHIPARPVVEPAIQAPDNRESITEEMKQAAGAALDGRKQAMRNSLKRAALDAQNRVKAWFTDARNHWAPNAPSTIRRKGSDRPMIDTGQLRNAIVGLMVIDGKRQ